MRTTALITAVLALGVLAGCGDDEPESTTAAVTTPATTTAETTSTATTTTSEGEETTTTDATGEGAEGPILAVAGVLTTHATAEEACGTFVTENFLETAYGGKENCLTAREEQPLASEIALDESAENTATHMTVIPKGGSYDGAKVEVDVVEEGGRYKVDALVADVPAGP
jgi:hypothetical protein